MSIGVRAAQRPTNASPIKGPVAITRDGAAPTPSSDQLGTLPAIPAFRPPAKFGSVDEYKAFAQNSGVSRLGAYRQQLSAAQANLSQAQQALSAHEQQLGYSSRMAALSDARKALDSAQHPMRDEAAKTRAQADKLKGQMDTLASQIGSAGEGQTIDNGAAGVSAYNLSNDTDAGSAIIDGLLTVGAAAAAASEAQHRQQLQAQLAQVEAEYAAQVQVAAQLDHTPGDPATVAKAQAAVAQAQGVVSQADSELAPDRSRVASAQATRDQAQTSVNNLEATRNYLTNYDQCFGFFTRLGLPGGWRQDLDSYWQQNR